MQISPVVNQMCGKAVPDGVNGIIFTLKSGCYYGFLNNLLNTSLTITTTLDSAVEEIFFRAVLYLNKLSVPITLPGIK